MTQVDPPDATDRFPNGDPRGPFARDEPAITYRPPFEWERLTPEERAFIDAYQTMRSNGGGRTRGRDRRRKKGGSPGGSSSGNR